MKPTLNLRWKTFGFTMMILVGLLLALMPSRLAGASLEARLAEYAKAIPPEGFNVTAATLATWLASGKPVAVVDVREHWEYDEYHIEGAAHVPLRDLATPEALRGIPADKPVVVVGRNDAAPGQGVAILRLSGRDAYALEGGLGAWWRDVLMPASIDSAIPETAKPSAAAQRVAWRAKFLGAAASGVAAAAPSPGTAPAAPAGTSRPAPAKPAAGRGKGC